MSAFAPALRPVPGRPAGSAPAGFTLIEVLVTVMVIAIGCLAVIQLQATAMRGGSQADQLTVASFLIESEIERLRSLEFAAVPAEAGTKCLNRTGVVIPCDAANASVFPYTLTTTITAGTPTSLSHQAVVALRWRDAHGPHQMSYDAIISRFSF